MKFKPSELANLFSASYKEENYDIDRFINEKTLSSHRIKVYIVTDEPNTIIIIHRGSADKNDWVDNVAFLKDNNIGSSKTYKLHKKKHMEVFKKYIDYFIVVGGHSRGALYAEKLYKDGFANQLITYNKPINMQDIMTQAFNNVIKKQNNKDVNVTNIRTENDGVSMGNKLINDKNLITIKNNSLNSIDAHKTDKLNDLDDNNLIGMGIFQKKIDYSKIRCKDLKCFIKQNKAKLNIKLNLTGLKKKQLIDISEEMMNK